MEPINTTAPAVAPSLTTLKLRAAEAGDVVRHAAKRLESAQIAYVGSGSEEDREVYETARGEFDIAHEKQTDALRAVIVLQNQRAAKKKVA